jgi:5-methylcytosine-specific restriction endonuclease McrA
LAGLEKYIGKMPSFLPVKDKNKEPIPKELRWLVWERDNFTCRHCGARQFLSVDHIIPESKGGTLDIGNLQTLCCACNSRKGAKISDETET